MADTTHLDSTPFNLRLPVVLDLRGKASDEVSTCLEKAVTEYGHNPIRVARTTLKIQLAPKLEQSQDTSPMTVHQALLQVSTPPRNNGEEMQSQIPDDFWNDLRVLMIDARSDQFAVTDSYRCLNRMAPNLTALVVTIQHGTTYSTVEPWTLIDQIMRMNSPDGKAIKLVIRHVSEMKLNDCPCPLQMDQLTVPITHLKIEFSGGRPQVANEWTQFLSMLAWKTTLTDLALVFPHSTQGVVCRLTDRGPTFESVKKLSIKSMPSCSYSILNCILPNLRSLNLIFFDNPIDVGNLHTALKRHKLQELHICNVSKWAGQSQICMADVFDCLSYLKILRFSGCPVTSLWGENPSLPLESFTILNASIVWSSFLIAVKNLLTEKRQNGGVRLRMLIEGHITEPQRLELLEVASTFPDLLSLRMITSSRGIECVCTDQECGMVQHPDLRISGTQISGPREKISWSSSGQNEKTFLSETRRWLGHGDLATYEHQPGIQNIYTEGHPFPMTD